MDTISNFYEHLVTDHINRKCKARDLKLDAGAKQDIACLALNQLPPRYVRHRIDAIFFIPDDERTQIDSNIDKAVSKAIDKVSSNPR